LTGVQLEAVLEDPTAELAIWQLRTAELGDSSYIVVSAGAAAIVDPQRDIGRYTAALDQLGVRLVAVVETHMHNDYLTGGPELARLGILAVRSLALAQVARQPLERLAERTGETINLAVRQGTQALNVDQVQSAHFVGMTDWTGRGAPLHATANGKALLAFGDGGLPEALEGCTTAYYLVHSMSESDFEASDRAAAETFRIAAEKAGVIHLVYLGGLAHGGDLTVASPGRGLGATFTAVLPLAGRPRRPRTQRPLPASSFWD